jgi:hypothetical protein
MRAWVKSPALLKGKKINNNKKGNPKLFNDTHTHTHTHTHTLRGYLKAKIGFLNKKKKKNN